MVYLRFGIASASQNFLHEAKNRYDEYKFTEKEYAEMITPEFGNTSYQKRKKYVVYLQEETIREYLPKHFQFIRTACGVSPEQIQM